MNSTKNTIRTKNPTIFVFNHDASLYGAQRSLLDILIRSKDDFNYVVFTPKDGPLVELLKANRIAVYVDLTTRWIYGPNKLVFSDIFNNPKKVLKCTPILLSIISLLTLPYRLLRLYFVAKNHNVDLIYTNTLTNIDGALLALLLRVPHVWHVRESLQGNSDLVSFIPENLITKFVSFSSSKIITNSLSLKTKLFSHDISNKVCVIYNGVDIGLFNSKNNLVNDAHQKPFTVAICGSINERKDVKTFIKMAEVVCESRAEIRFVVIGNKIGDYYDAIVDYIKDKKLREHLIFLGHQDNIPEVFSEIDVLVSTAIYEPFGKTIIEAMAGVKPVIATKSGGPEEIILDQTTGFLVDIGDYQAIARLVMDLADNPDKVKKLGMAGRNHVLENFEVSKSVGKVTTCFNALVSKSANN